MSSTVEEVEELSTGETSKITRTVDEGLVEQYAEVSSDFNPLHLDDDYAEQTMFDERIAHGGLINSFVSAALARFPGVIVYLNQNSTFKEPVPIGEEVTAIAEIESQLESDSYAVDTRAELQDGTVVLDGTAEILVK